MNIAIVNPYFDPFMVGGAEHSLLILASKLAQAGHNIHVIANAYDARSGKESRDGYAVHWLQCPIRAQPGAFIDDAAYLQSKEYASRVDAAVLRLTTAKPGCCLVIANNAQSWGAVSAVSSTDGRVKRVAVMRDAQAICEFGVCIESRQASQAKPCQGPWQTLHCGIRFVQDRGEVPLIHWLGVATGIVRANRRRRRLRKSLSKMDRIVTVSDALRQLLYQSVTLDRQKAVTIPNFASPDDVDESAAMALRQQHGLEARTYCLVTGKKSRGKGTDIAVRAMKHPRVTDSNIRMVIAGRGEACVGSGVVDLPHLPVGVLLGLLKSALALVVPGRCQEGLHRTMIDAVRLGIPVICTEAGGVHEGVVDGQNGRVISCDSPAALSAAISEIADWKPARDEHCRKVAARIYEEKFSEVVIMKQWNRLMEDLIRE